jgi:hypothetical protein
MMSSYAITEDMLSSDGLTLVEPHATPYVTFLACQISDLIAYFEARDHRVRGDVTVPDNPTFDRSHLSPPPLNWGTPNTSGVSWAEDNPTPRHPGSAQERPQSGVKSIDLLLRLYFDYLGFPVFFSLVTRPLLPQPSS